MRASLDTRQELEANSAGYGVCRNCVSIKRLETGHRSSARTNRIEANVSSAFTAQLRAAFSPGPQNSTRRRPMMVRGCYCVQRLTFVRRRQQCKLRVLLRGEYLRMHSIGVRLHPDRTDRMVVNIGETRYRFAVWNLASACSQYRSW